MSLCRSIILRAVPKYPRWQSNAKVQNVCKVATASRRPDTSCRGVLGRVTISQTANASSLSAAQSFVSPALSEAKVNGTVTAIPSVSVDTYFTLRQEDPSLVAHLPKSSYLHLIDALFAVQCFEWADAIIIDIASFHQRTPQDKFELLQAILAQGFPRLGPRAMSKVLHFFEEHPELELDAVSVMHLMRLFGKQKAITEGDLRGLRCVIPALLPLIREQSVPGGTMTITYIPPSLIYFTFELLRNLLAHSHQQAALELFRPLVEARFIPSEAVQGLDGLSPDFNMILRVALTRACLHWHWRSLAATLLSDAFQASPQPHQIVLDLHTDLLYELLNTPSPSDISACRQLICHAHPIAPVPDSIIRLFYNHAYKQMAAEDAEHLYAFTRSQRIAESHVYSPPQGESLTWLMEHFTRSSQRSHLSRTLASEVVDDNIPLPPLVRAPFISCVAAQGNSTLARKLWERYAVGRDKNLIVGSSDLLIRMVSLFRTQGMRAFQNARDVNFPLEDREDDDEKMQLIKGRSFHAFAELILLEFKAAHWPLSTASHRILTSYARACFILDKYSEGLSVFRTLLERRELPDMYDVNVALSAVAPSQPKLALEIIERMEKRKLRPDAVTYGTILHAATLHGDRHLVNKMLAELNTMSGQPMSLKTLTNIIRAITVRHPEESLQDIQSKLSIALDLINVHGSANISSSTQTGRYLVYQCLQAQAPVLAFKFWRRCLKESAEWNDREQLALRRRIGRMAEEHSDRMNPILLSSILTQLRLIPKLALTPPP